MLNLIPPQGQQTVRYEYLARLAATWCLLFAAAVFFLTVALVPTYVLIQAQIKELSVEAPLQSGGGIDLASVEAEVAQSTALLAELKKTPQTPPLSVLLRTIEASAPTGVSLRTYNLARAKNGLSPIQVSGVAETREGLVTFTNALESHAYFEKADVPIADLARERDVSFSLTITVAKQQ